MNYMQRAFDGAEPEPIVESDGRTADVETREMSVPEMVQSTFDAHIEADHLRAEVERLTRECGDLRERIRIAMSALSVASARAVNAEAERDDLKARVEALADVWRKGETRHITTRLVASLLRSAMK